MDFNFIRQIRWAGIIVQFIGLYFTNWYLIIFGTIGFFASYMLSVQKMEDYYTEINRILDAKENEQTTETKEQEEPKI